MKYPSLGLLLLLIFFSCGKDKGPKQPDFDRAAMLENYADQLIQPAYQQLNQEANALQVAWDAFVANPNTDQLLAMQAQWLKTALAWQSANAYNFGPAGEQGLLKSLVEEIGLFPVSVSKVEAYVAAGDVSLNNFDRDSRGLLAIEYLIYGTTSDPQEVLLDLQDAQRSAYLTAIIAHMRQRVSAVVSAWQTYRTDFVQNDGTDVGSSTSQLYNEFVRSFESVKNFKVAVPAGKRAGQTQAEPQLVEAFYSGQSLQLLKAHIEAIERIYYGTNAAGVDGPGFQEYLQKVEGGPALISATEAQWQAVKTALAQVPESPAFSVLIQNEDPSIGVLFTELQKHTRFFKSDMSSLLGIAITYNSGDGD